MWACVLAFVTGPSARKERSVRSPSHADFLAAAAACSGLPTALGKAPAAKGSKPQLPLKCPQSEGSEAAAELLGTGARLRYWSLLAHL